MARAIICANHYAMPSSCSNPIGGILLPGDSMPASIPRLSPQPSLDSDEVQPVLEYRTRRLFPTTHASMEMKCKK
jgi:hypothetical protein